MEIIDKGLQIILDLISTSPIDNTLLYKKSIFNLYLPVEKGVIIYNTLTRAICLCNETEYCKLIQGDYTDDYSTSLFSYGFLTHTDIDEMKICDQVRYVLNGFDNQNFIDDFTILTTTNCNARCQYCYESDCKKFDMTMSTASELVDFIISNNVNNTGKSLNLSWFGGEPLCNYKIINFICENLKVKGFKINSSMISNGYLFNDELIKCAKENWNLTKVQITLDGTEEKYNIIKNYVDNERVSPFIKVCTNIEKLLKSNIKVAIRLNATNENISDLYQLVEYISIRFTKYNNFYVYTGIVTDYSSIDNMWNNSERNNLIKERNKLEDHIYSLGLKKYIRPSKRYKTSQCMADNQHSLVVYPDGTLGKCEHFEQRNTIGDIFQRNIDYNEINNWRLSHNNKEMCKGCVYYPLCIRLVKCPAFKDLKCNVTEASYYLTNLKHSIISVYQDWIGDKAKYTNDGSVC